MLPVTCVQSKFESNITVGDKGKTCDGSGETWNHRWVSAQCRGLSDVHSTFRTLFYGKRNCYRCGKQCDPIQCMWPSNLLAHTELGLPLLAIEIVLWIPTLHSVMNIVQHKNKDRLLEERQGAKWKFRCSFQLYNKTPEACVSSTAVCERGGFCSSDTGESKVYQGKNIIYVPIFALESKWICERWFHNQWHTPKTSILKFCPLMLR